MTDLLPPYHKPMASELECDLANDRVAALEAELERATGERDRYEKQRDRAEQKYDALLVQLPKSTDYEFEVFDAEDGMPGLRMVSYKDRDEQAEAERDIWHTRFSILQTAASGAGDRECQHDSISGNVCDGCGAYIKTVRLDDIGLVADILDYGQAEAELERAREELALQSGMSALVVKRAEQAEADLADMTKELERLKSDG